MLLNLKTVFLNEDEQQDISYSFSLSDMELDGVFPFTSPIQVSATAQNRASLVSLKINVSFTYSRSCDRCNADISKHVCMDFTHTLVTGQSDDNGDYDYIEIPDYKLELDELVTSDILLDLSSKNLCRQDCKGLCYKCGANLNLGDCGCDKKVIDPRLEILKQLID